MYHFQKSRAHPAKPGHSKRDTCLEVIRILLAEAGNEADSSCDNPLYGWGERQRWWNI